MNKPSHRAIYEEESFNQNKWVYLGFFEHGSRDYDLWFHRDQIYLAKYSLKPGSYDYTYCTTFDISIPDPLREVRIRAELAGLIKGAKQ